jgi:hypothetical protein
MLFDKKKNCQLCPVTCGTCWEAGLLTDCLLRDFYTLAKRGREKASVQKIFPKI